MHANAHKRHAHGAPTEDHKKSRMNVATPTTPPTGAQTPRVGTCQTLSDSPIDLTAGAGRPALPNSKLCTCKRKAEQKETTANRWPTAVGWEWDGTQKSDRVQLYGENRNTVLFHPGWSNGTAAVRGTHRINGSVVYWEIDVSHRLFGTSLMFGIGTSKANVDTPYYTNLVGADEHSYGLSHKGQLFHRGTGVQFTTPFAENEPVTIGLLFDGVKGTLSYFKNGVSLGVAFNGLQRVTDDLFPMISSTAARTEMTLGPRVKNMRLEEMCISQLVRTFENQDPIPCLDKLPLAPLIRQQIKNRLRIA